MTLFQFYKKFDTDEKCRKYLKNIRWPDGKITCAYCGHPKCYVIENGDRFKCANNKCYKRFKITVGTIFHAANIPLWQFFYLIFSSCMNKKNISSIQQGKNLGIMQKTTWAAMMKIRNLCWQDDSLKLCGEVEVDETYLRMAKWKKEKQSDKGKDKSRKYPILGLLQRGGEVVIKVIPTKEKRIVQDVIFKHIEVDSRLLTDSAPCYFGLSSYYKHESVNHRAGEYVRGDVYTNGIESVWNHLKNAIRSTHGNVSQLHIQKYCDEFAYRFNNRHLSPDEMFTELMTRACNFKIAYKGIIKNVRRKEIKNSYKRYKVVDTETGQTYGSQKEAAVDLGISTNYLSKMLRGSEKNTTTLEIVHNV